MSLVVVDASVLFACLAKEGRTRDVLMTTRASLMAPPYLLEEMKKLLPKASRFAGVHTEVLQGILDHLTTYIQVMAAEACRHKRPEAQRLCQEADAWGDDEYVALALALDASIWTFDDDFSRIPGIHVVTTRDVDVDNT